MPASPSNLESIALPAAEQTDTSDTDTEGRAMSPSSDDETENSPTGQTPLSTSSSDDDGESTSEAGEDPPSSNHDGAAMCLSPENTLSSTRVTRGTSSHEVYGTPDQYVDVSTRSTGTPKNRPELKKIPESIKLACSTMTSNYNNTRTMMDDGERSVVSHQASIDPDGVMPSHRKNSSRKFSVDSMLGNELLLDYKTTDNGDSSSEDPETSPAADPLESTDVRRPQHEEKKQEIEPPSQPMSPLESTGAITVRLEDSIQDFEDEVHVTQTLLRYRTATSMEPEPEPPLEATGPITAQDEDSIREFEYQGHEPEALRLKYRTSTLMEPEPETPLESAGAIKVQLEDKFQEFDEHGTLKLRYRTSASMEPESHQLPQESDLSGISVHTGGSAVGSPLGHPDHSTLIVPQRDLEYSVPQGQQQPQQRQMQQQPQHTPFMVPQLHRSLQVPVPTPAHAPGNGYHHHALHQVPPMPPPVPPPSAVMMSSHGGKRKIHLRLIEDVSATQKLKSSFLSFRRRPSRSILKTPGPNQYTDDQQPQSVDRGRVTVSWYDGTTSLELYEHVRNSVIRKLELRGTVKLSDMRILDESTSPPEEIVLSPYIPSGSSLLLRFTTKDAGGDITPVSSYAARRLSYTGGAPDSPSAAPSPHASTLDLNGLGLNPNQLALLGVRLKGLSMPSDDDPKPKKRLEPRKTTFDLDDEKVPSMEKAPKEKQPDKNKDDMNKDDDDNNSRDSTMEMNSLHPEDRIQRSLQNITELLLTEREKKVRYVPKQEKRQVVFVLANYFVLFLSLIAISAEIQSRAPGWNAAVERHLNSVHNCSKDQDALFECVSNGDLAGLVASVVLWISRSAATKRIFLFGFDSPRKLWTVVYESMVTAVCWGFSYMFIRRGMNPDTSRNFLQKYWKDAVYGSLAGFNAAFMKQILKNLIPQEAIEDALQDRQLKILSWLS